jgi:hypothetical protein
MSRLSLRLVVAVLLLLTVRVGQLEGQSSPVRLKVATTDRPNRLLLKLEKLGKFSMNFGDRLQFSDMKVVKTALAFYLLAEEQDSQCIFAFELEQKKRRLFLTNKLVVQFCKEGELSLQTFLQVGGKIDGCKKSEGGRLTPMEAN